MIPIRTLASEISLSVNTKSPFRTLVLTDTFIYVDTIRSDSFVPVSTATDKAAHCIGTMKITLTETSIVRALVNVLTISLQFVSLQGEAYFTSTVFLGQKEVILEHEDIIHELDHYILCDTLNAVQSHVVPNVPK